MSAALMTHRMLEPPLGPMGADGAATGINGLLARNLGSRAHRGPCTRLPNKPNLRPTGARDYELGLWNQI